MDEPNKPMQPIRKVEPQIPDPSANDDSRAALEAAARNYKLVKDQWCDCEELHDSVYFRSRRDWLSWLDVRSMFWRHSSRLTNNNKKENETLN